MSELIYPRTTYTFEPAGSDNQVTKRYTNRELAARVGGPTPARMCDLVGREVTHFAGGPGIGSVTYRVTGVDERGVWGVIVSNTIRELSPSEVV